VPPQNLVDRKMVDVSALDSRLANRRQRSQGSGFCPLRHLSHHRGSHLAGGQGFEEREDTLTLRLFHKPEQRALGLVP